MPTIDFWTNVRSPGAVAAWQQTPALRGVTAFFGTAEPLQERGPVETLRDMDDAGVDVSVVSGMAGVGAFYPMHNYSIDDVLGWCAEHPTRLKAALTLEGLGSISVVCRKIEEASRDVGLGLVRVICMTLNETINSPRLYPVYERCEALGIPVSINVGVPGPKMRLRYQDPTALDDVLIDFPDLTVVAAHMGHPWESLLIRLMRKYERLYLCNSAWLATYLDPAVIRFMDSSVGRDRLIFASDAPMISQARALDAARKLPVSAEALDGFLGANAARVLGLSETATVAAGATP